MICNCKKIDKYLLESQKGKMIKANILPTYSILNARDLGGYLGQGGRRIKKHRLLRTGTISNVSKQDQNFLQDYGLRKIINLRSISETRDKPDIMIENAVNYSIPLSEEDGTLGENDNSTAQYNLDPLAGLHAMIEHYRDHVIKEYDRNTVHKVLKIMADTEEGAILFHCTEGKDRTGFVAFFILYILGVDLKTIRQDYLLSNYLLEDYRWLRDQKFKANGENLIFRANMRVLSSACDILFDTIPITIEQEFGGMDFYLRNQLKVTPDLQEKLQNLYLENKKA